jgi:hypothetical protein
MTRALARALVVAGLLVAAVAHGGEPWLPDGEAVKKSVEARKGKTELGKLAASMKPGTWAELKTEMPAGLWSSPKVGGGRNEGGSGGLHIAGWTDDAHWDCRTGQFFYMGLRQTRRFIAYSEEKNAWRSIDLDPKGDNPCFRTKFGHIYSSNGFDYERSRFYHRYNGFEDEKEGLKLAGGISFFDVVTEKWTKLPPVPPESTFTGMAIEYFGAMDGLVILGKDAWFFSTVRQKWEKLGASPVDGYHSLIRHNPYRQEVLMAGGNQQPQTVARLRKDGKIEKLKDFPTHLSVQSDKITIDPASGRYLMLGGNKDEPKKLYEFDSDKNEYRVLEAATAQYPYTRYSMPVCAFVPEHGVVMWAENKVFLYKHDPDGKYPAANSAPQAGDDKAKEKPGKGDEKK